jgi:regulator of extracellular matrix RemA (YlzA/DUF370 family)
VNVVSSEAFEVQRLIREAKEQGRAIDMTTGRRPRAVATLDTGQVALLGLTVKELGRRGLPVPVVAGRKRRKRTR